MLVAHTKRPSVCSSPLRAIFFEARRSWSWAWSFASLFWAEADGVDIQVKLPSAPEDVVPEVDLAPRHWREDGLEKDRQESKLLGRGWPV